MSTAWLLAPVAAGLLALSTDWALMHDPLGTASAAATHAVQPPATSRLQQQAQTAARRLQHTQISLARLETALQRRSAQLSFLEADIRAVQQARQSGSAVPLPRGGAVAPAPAAAPLPAPVAVPAAPPVNATTGAS